MGKSLDSAVELGVSLGSPSAQVGWSLRAYMYISARKCCVQDAAEQGHSCFENRLKDKTALAYAHNALHNSYLRSRTEPTKRLKNT